MCVPKNDTLIPTAGAAPLAIGGEGVGFLLLLAAAWHTGLITALPDALPRHPVYSARDWR
ncbi:MAG TPA: hypothetical protein VGJ87_18635 [Roseiflexaceae bacterium]|jgi:hypothetical protein